MRKPISIYLTMAVGMSIVTASPRPVSAQVPDPNSAPRLAVPARGALAAPQDQAAPAAAPAAQTPGQPTAAAAPAEPAPVTAVTGPPAGVTTVGGASPATSSSSQAATMRGYTAGNFGLTLEGVQIAALKSAEGGFASSDVVVEKPGPGNISAKHLGGVRYDAITVTTSLDSKPLNDWISASWKGNGLRKNGSVATMDYDYKIVENLEFFNALITETTFPALDAASKDAAQIIVKLGPEYTRLQPGSGAKGQAPDAKTQKRWMPANFRFEMAGLDGSKVNKINSLTVRQTTAENPVGELRDYQKEPGKIEFPNLKVTLAAASAQSWIDWHQDFVVKGNNGQDKERAGAIVYLDLSRQTELGRINLSDCGIFGLTPEKVEAGSENIRRMIADLYCERMELVVKDAVK